MFGVETRSARVSGSVPLLRKPGTRRTPLQWWHLLSLDAPSVAAVWTASAGRAVGVQVPRSELAAIFLAVWMVYVLDRLFDAAPLHGLPGTDLEERHRFHHRHRRLWLRVLAVGVPVLALLVQRMPAAELLCFAGLGALLAGWGALVHLRPHGPDRSLPKELAVGVFFAATVFLPPLVRRPHALLTLLPFSFLFACLCTWNCLLLTAWEHPGTPRALYSRNRTNTVPHPLLALVLLVGSVAALAVDGMNGAGQLAHPLSLGLAIALSTLLLLFLHGVRRRVSPLTLRALADLVLLTPLLCIGRPF